MEDGNFIEVDIFHAFCVFSCEVFGKFTTFAWFVRARIREHRNINDIKNKKIMKKVIATPDAPKAVGPYSQAIEVNGTLYISGQIPVNPADGKVQEDIVAAAHQSLKNIGAILKEAGMTYDNVVKTTVLLADIADFKAVNEVYAEYFTGDKPARACYQAAALPLGVTVEIEAIAVR